MRVALLAALLLLAPTAAAAVPWLGPCFGSVACAVERHEGWGSCTSEHGFERDSTTLTADAAGADVLFVGARECYRAYGQGTDWTTIYLVASYGDLGVIVYWTEADTGSSRSCSFVAYVAPGPGAGYGGACPAGLAPPDPGWGDVLP